MLLSKAWFNKRWERHGHILPSQSFAFTGADNGLGFVATGSPVFPGHFIAKAVRSVSSKHIVQSQRVTDALGPGACKEGKKSVWPFFHLEIPLKKKKS